MSQESQSALSEGMQVSDLEKILHTMLTAQQPFLYNLTNRMESYEDREEARDQLLHKIDKSLSIMAAEGNSTKLADVEKRLKSLEDVLKIGEGIGKFLHWAPRIVIYIGVALAAGYVMYETKFRGGG